MVSIESPVLTTVMVKLAVPPVRIVWLLGLLVMLMAGSMTVTSASSESPTVPPAACEPTTEAVLVKSAVTLPNEQV